MNTDRKRKLVDLGAEVLADGLLELALSSDAGDDLVERLIATPQQNVQRFKDKLYDLKHSTRYVDWEESHGFSRELEMLLLDLKAGVTDPLTGVELVAAFYETDQSVFERCDDSSGTIGDVYSSEAQSLFVEYASSCTEKEKVAEIILKLNRKDSYGVRDTLFDCAGDCLPEPVVRGMITKLQRTADKASDEYDECRNLSNIESLARQLKDARLFEHIRIALRGEPSARDHIHIARVYLESGDVGTAHSWLKKIPEGVVLDAYERDQLLQEIYRRQGDSGKLTGLFYKQFKDHYSISTLKELLQQIGDDKRDTVVADAVAQILQRRPLRASDAEFLVAIGRIDEAEEYLLKRADKLDGGYYGSLLSLAEAMAADNRNFVSSLIYRSLLLSILKRGYTKAYPHGVRYLNKLDDLSVNISDWKNVINHEVFKERLYEDHGRKRSFWAQY